MELNRISQGESKRLLGGCGPTPVSKADHHADLVELIAQERDQSAFVQLFHYFAPRLKSYLMRTGCDISLSEEITQETLATLWRKANLFDRKKSTLSTWLFRIARNHKVDQVRRNAARALDLNDPTLFADMSEFDDCASDAMERDKQIRLALKALSPAQRDIIRLSFFEAKSHSTIASEMSLPLGTVKGRIRLAFVRLRDMLKNNKKVDIE